MKFNFTYSGIVLAAEATLSLDSFFFIALEAIFVKFQRFSKTKLISKQSKVCCHVNQVARASTPRVGSPAKINSKPGKMQQPGTLAKSKV